MQNLRGASWAFQCVLLVWARAHASYTGVVQTDETEQKNAPIRV